MNRFETKERPWDKWTRLLLEKLPGMKGNAGGHMGEVVRGAATAFTVRALGSGFGFAFNLLLAKKYGASGMGLYFLALSVASVATVFGKLGLDNTLLRFVAANASTGRWAAVKGVYAKGMVMGFLASAFAAAVLAWCAPWVSASVFHQPGLLSPVRWIALAVVPLSLLTLQAEMLKGLKRIRDSLFVNGAAVPFFSLLALAAFRPTWGVSGAVGAFAVGTVAAALLGFGLWRSATAAGAAVTASFPTAELVKSSMPLFGVSCLDLVNNWASTFILGVWGGAKEVGVFAAANRTSMLISLVLVAVNSILAPKFAALHHQKDGAALSSTARLSARWMLFVTGPLLVVLALFPGFIMGLFGAEFRQGAPLLLVLAAGQFLNVSTGSVGYLLMMSGNEKSVRNTTAFTAVLGLSLSLVLVPRWGAMGAAISTAVGTAAWNLVCMHLVWRKLGIWTSPIFPKGWFRG